jgi:DNA-binding transcriptional ArsR family regulator
MPVEFIETTDPITHLIEFQTSPVHELIVSLQNFTMPHKHKDWVEQAYLALGDEFRQVIKANESSWVSFGCLEVGIDYPNQEDVPGFLKYVRELAPERFLFYFLCRLFPIEQIQATQLDPDALLNMVLTFPDLARHTYLPTDPYWTYDVPLLQNQMADLWQWYWEGFLQHQIERLRPLWHNAINEKQAILARVGGMALLEQVTGKKELPTPIPPHHPWERIMFMPMALLPRSAYLYHGYGKIAVLFDAQQNPNYEAELERLAQQTLETLQALGDENRLRILRLIAPPGSRYNGKKIAEKLGMTPSTVSRHMSQLKAGDLIVEESIDNRNIIYALKKETVTKLSDDLTNYIFG